MTERRHGLETRHETADASPGLLLWQVTNQWQGTIRAALKPLELTHVQFVLLASLTYLADDRPVSQKQLADHAATDPMMTSQVLRTLEQRGLVERGRDPHDARARALAITPAGAELANRAVRVVEDCDESFFGSLGAAQVAFVRCLSDLSRRQRDPLGHE